MTHNDSAPSPRATPTEDDATARAYLAAFFHDQIVQAAEDRWPAMKQTMAAESAAWEGSGHLKASTARWFRQWVHDTAFSAGTALCGPGTRAAYLQAKKDLAAVDRWLAAHDYEKEGVSR
ncbi:hypothetical protein ACFXOL_20975 [Streptomyces californicus]|uniref:hypothetical protein n=1 Tax=Streptomyces californicus TaxID=67351 RepID=UPI00364C8C8E